MKRITVTTPHRFTSAKLVIVPTLLAISGVNAFGFYEFDRGVFTLNTKAVGTYDSYFLGSASHSDDFYASLIPQLDYSRKAGLGKLDASVGVAINRYDKNTSYNSEDLLANLTATLPVEPGSRISGDFNAGYTEGKQIDPTILDRVSAKTANAGAHFNYQLGLKTSLSDSATYSKSWRSIYSDQETISNNLGFTYSDFLENTNFRFNHEYDRTKSSSNLFFGIPLDETANSFTGSLSHPIYESIIGEVTYGYRLLTRDRADTATGQRHTNGSIFSASINGPFLPPSRFPKLKSSLSLSYEESAAPGINDTGGKTITGAMNLAWSARERTDLFINANRSLELSINDLTVENTQVSTGFEERLGLATQLNGTASYSWHKFRGISRDDHTFEFNLGLNHSLARHWTAGITYLFQKNHTDATGFQPTRFMPTSYNRSVVSVAITNVF